MKKEAPIAEKEKELQEDKMEEVKIEVEKDVITEVPDVEKEVKPEIKIDVEGWTPKTELGRQVKAGQITDIDQILSQGKNILEDQIVDILLPGAEKELLMIGQSKGKFGGGAKRIFKQTQKKTTEGNKPSFCCIAAIGNNNGYVGVGFGKSKDTVPAREKAIRKAKINMFKIRRGAGSWEDTTSEPHSIPFKVEGKCGSVRIVLMPAPLGKGLIIERECAKILRLAGIKNVYSKTFGMTSSKQNLIKACVSALKKLNDFKARPKDMQSVGLIEGRAMK
jgi:small subunit ribosomal protein S5